MANFISRLAEFIVTDPDNQDFLRLLEVEELAYGLKRQRFEHFKCQLDINTIEDRFLGSKLREKGWGADIELTYTQQRRLLRYVTTILKDRGWVPTIIDTIYLLFGIELQNDVLNSETLGYWRIGYSKIGIDTKIGTRGLSSTILFKLDPSVIVDEETRNKIKQVVEYLRPATKLFIYAWEQSANENLPLDGFFIGYAKIGVSQHTIAIND